MEDIEITEEDEKNREKLIEKVREAIYTGENLVYKNRYVVNHIGEAIYLDLDFLTEVLTKEEVDDILEEIRLIKQEEKEAEIERELRMRRKKELEKIV